MHYHLKPTSRQRKNAQAGIKFNMVLQKNRLSLSGSTDSILYAHAPRIYAAELIPMGLQHTTCQMMSQQHLFFES